MLDSTEKKRVRARLRRIEGQIGAIQRMIDDDKYCVDVLLQVAAAQGALGKVGKVILGAHMNTCVSEAFTTGNSKQRSAKIEELLEVFSRYGHLGARGA